MLTLPIQDFVYLSFLGNRLGWVINDLFALYFVDFGCLNSGFTSIISFIASVPSVSLVVPT